MQKKKKHSILVVDDMSQIRTILKFTLNKAGYHVEVAPSGTAGIKKASEKPVDLILLDVMMPKVDGYNVISALKRQPDTKDIPIIFLTAKAQKSDVLKGIQMGADDYVVKPYKFQDLEKKIRKLLEARKNDDQS